VLVNKKGRAVEGDVSLVDPIEDVLNVKPEFDDVEAGIEKEKDEGLV